MHHQPNLYTLRPLVLMFVINILSVLIEQIKGRLLKTCWPCIGYWPEKAKIQSQMEPLIYTQIREGKNKSKMLKERERLQDSMQLKEPGSMRTARKKKSNQTS